MDRREAARLLGVSEQASRADVQRAYLRLVRRTHPDTMPAATDEERQRAARRFGELVQARQLLLDHPPVIPIVVDPPVRHGPLPKRRRRGVGSSLAAITVVVFLVLALVSLGDAFRIIHVVTLLP